MGAAVAAAVAWGWMSPEPERPAEPRAPDEVLPPAAVVETAVEPGSRAPAWVRPTIVWTLSLIVTIGVALTLLGILRQVVLYLVLALFFSFALEPAVNYLHRRRGWRRGAATGTLLALVFLLLVLVVLIFLPTLIRGAKELVERVPQWAEQTEEWASDTLGVDVSTGSISDTANDASASLEDSEDEPIEVLVGFSASLIGGIFALFTVGMFIFYMVAEGPKFKRAVLSFFSTQRQEELVSIWEAAIEKTGGYFYSKLVIAGINGSLFFLVMFVLDVPGAAPLALFEATVSAFIPIVGTYIGAAVPILSAWFAVGMPEALIMLIYILIYQQVENYLIAPKLQGKTMQIHPAVAFGAALAGGAIGGLLWAFLALPFAATIQASASLWFERHEVLETEFTREPEPRPVEEVHPSIGNRVGGWVRSSRGWLRRRKPVEEAVDGGDPELQADPTPDG
jgi:predicted PurR-regulated permease PerM